MDIITEQKPEHVALTVEEPWNEGNEALIRRWQSECLALAERHNATALAMKRRHVRFGLPSVLLPLTMAPISATFADEAWIKYINMGSFLVTGLLSGIYNFFQFSKKMQQHFDAENRYADLAQEVEAEFAHAPEFRQQADVFIAKMKLRYASINSVAPALGPSRQK